MFLEEQIVRNGYIKLLALDIGHLETTILMEKNTNISKDLDDFKSKYGSLQSVIIFVIHMNYDNDLKFCDYKKVCENIHPFDYVIDLVTKKNGDIIHRTDITNESLWVQSRIKYIQK